MKIDFKKTFPTYRARKGRFDVVTVPRLQYLMIDGHGDPNTSVAYAEALATLYPVAYKFKFFSKNALDRDYVVPPLEALWWADDMEAFTTGRDKSRWDWTAMLMVPDWLDDDHLRDAIDQLRAKGGAPALDSLRLEGLDEGLAAQTLHVGSYDDEAPVLAEMHDAFIPTNGYVMTGKHHEIYLSDPRRTTPDKLRTILRQPVEPTSAAHPASGSN
ncbi:MAG: GyrI-like domain-containing protein [Microthrixaceae bacterium]